MWSMYDYYYLPGINLTLAILATITSISIALAIMMLVRRRPAHRTITISACILVAAIASTLYWMEVTHLFPNSSRRFLTKAPFVKQTRYCLPGAVLEADQPYQAFCNSLYVITPRDWKRIPAER